MQLQGWQYYNHAVVPTTAPHEEVDITPIKDGSIWQIRGGIPLFARWTSDWDCGHETNWWFCIRDGVYDVDQLSSSSRKHIRQAMKKNRVVRTRITEDILDDLYRIYDDATSHYENADNILDENTFKNGMRAHPANVDLFLAYDEENIVHAYMTVKAHNDWVEILAAKFDQTAMKIQSSNAIYNVMLDYYLNVKQVKYVSSGARSINHETGTQEYKERVFGYRKAYCKLHVAYKPVIRPIIALLYPFRKVLKKYDRHIKIHQLNAVLKQEELFRQEN